MAVKLEKVSYDNHAFENEYQNNFSLREPQHTIR